MAISVVTMGVHFRWRLPEVLVQQLRLAHDLREDLVSAQHDYDQQIKDVWSRYPAVAAAETVLAELEQRAETAADIVKKARVVQRTKRITGPAADDLRAARAAVKQARQARREAIAAVKDEAGEYLRAAVTDLKAHQKQLYGQYCQSGDLYWATYNSVLDHHKTAVKMVTQRRQHGQPAALRHHRFDGTGTIAVQLQRHAGQPARTPMVIADPAGKYRNVLTVPWHDPDVLAPMPRTQRRRLLHGMVRMRCGSLGGDPQWIDIPVLQHRMLPPDADIVSAQLTITRTADRTHASLAITAKTGDTQKHSDETHPDVAVHLGWRDAEHHTVVAHWRATSTVIIPPTLQHLIHADPDGTTGTITLPHNISDQSTHADQTASTRANTFNDVRETVAVWADEHAPLPHPAQPDDTLTGADIRRWRSPGRLVRLAADWSGDDAPDGASDIVDTINQWRIDDLPQWRREAFSRRKAANRRRDHYRVIAAFLAATAGRIIVDDTSIADIARGAADTDDIPTELAHKIAHRRSVTAPGQLRECITAAATREAVPLTIVPAAGLSRIHPRCGHENPADGRYIAPVVTCDGCGAHYRPDTAATTTMLTRALTAS